MDKQSINTTFYNGMYINESVKGCYVTNDSGTFRGIMFPSTLAAKRAITKARGNGVPASR